MRVFELGCCAAFVVCCGLAGEAHAVNIVPVYVNDDNGTWTATQKTVVQDALNDWGAHVLTNQTFNVTFDFVQWTPGVIHTVDVNVDYMNAIMSNQFIFTTGPVPQDDWDAYTAILHEMGHAMGFSRNFYYDDAGLAGQTDKWTSHINGTTF